MVTGGQTNQRAEILAATAAIRIAMREGFRDLKIYTDSMYVHNGATDWIKNKWKRNGWRNARGGIVSNKDDWVKLDAMRFDYERIYGEIKWEHVSAHKGNYGNEQADKLARRAAQRQLDAFLQYREESSYDDDSSSDDC